MDPVRNLAELLTLPDFEAASDAVLDQGCRAYVAGGAGTDRTVRANIAAFDDIWLRPRVLASTTTEPRTDVTVLGHHLSMPVLLAPTSPQRLLHEDAEIATSLAAEAAGVVPVVSTDSHVPYPEIAKASGRAGWFQLYAYRSRDDIAATIDMAETAGATALVVTVDASHAALRVHAQRAGFSTPGHVDFGTLRALGILEGEVPAGARIDRLSLSWEDLLWIRARTRLPLLVKGVLRADDARRCLDSGADGVIVSNHGGRQLDGAVPSVVALSEVAAEVDGRCAVLMDSGIRSGVHVVKALALGADAVCLGRPYLWGLSVAGREGVEAVLRLLRREIEDTLRQLGAADVNELGPHFVAKAGAGAAAGAA
ncbi:alpha-hydroxy acid oxidase [Streptomyces chrestomyceticus]|uniref:alpha-hydroxy acid oxidase n=1 Tax=Streptomyces chrestomyceticus TaxID=68185 RepID=UPI0037B9234C